MPQLPSTPPTRSAAAGRRPVAVLVGLAVVAALVVLPVPGVASWTDGCAAAAPGQARVGLVVDFGTEPGSPGGVEVACVVVAEGAMASDVLVAWARARGDTRWSNGLLCAIGGYPTSGCGDRTADGYLYWSYWMGQGGTWTHAGMGPGYRRVSDGVIEGWRFQRGAGNPSDAPPRRPASTICPPEAPPPSPPTPAPVPAPAPKPSAAPVVPSAPLPPVDDRGDDVPPPTSARPAGDEAAPADEADEVDPAADGEPDDAAATDPDDGGHDEGTPSTEDPEAVEVVDATEMAAGSLGGSGPGAPPAGLVAVAVVAVALGAAAAVRFRRSA